MLPETCSYAPRKLGASDRAVPVEQRSKPRFITPPAIKTIKTPERKLRDAAAAAAREASELQTSWERRCDSAPGTQDELLYSELRYAQGRADALQEAVELKFGGTA